MEPIFHIAHKSEWLAAQKSGIYTPGNFAKEGFIHCCFEQQIDRVLHDYFAEQTDLVRLRIDTGQVVEKIRLAASPAGGMYPHIFSELAVSAVIETTSL